MRPSLHATASWARLAHHVARLSIFGVAALGCGGPSGASSDATTGSTGGLALSLPATHTGGPGTQPIHATWSMAAELSFDAAGGTGWLAIDGFVVDGNPPVDQPTTRAAALSGQAQGGGVAFAPFTIALPGIEGSVAFDTFVIDPSSSPLVGHAAGTFHRRVLDQIDDWAFSGDLALGPDHAAPRVFGEASQPQPVALDPVELVFSEPVDVAAVTLTATSAGAPIAVATTPILDAVSGRAIGVTAVPTGYWPSSATVELSVDGFVDVGGNRGTGAITVETPALVDPSGNLGFESGLGGWLTRSPDLVAAARATVEYFDENGAAQVVSAPVGSSMCGIPAGASVTTFLVPPPGASTLSMELALINNSPVKQLQDANRGVFVELVTLSGLVVAATGADLPRPANPQARWTGFHTLTVTLPSDAASGFWLTVRSGAYEPPINAPDVLLDDVRF